MHWTWNATRKNYEIAIPASNQQPDIIKIHPLASGQLAGLLKRAARQSYLDRLLKKPDQGKVHEVASQWSTSSHFMRTGLYTRFCEWRFIHRARLGVVPLNATRRFGTGDKRCRRCGDALETLPHVINHCPLLLTAMQMRHNAVQNRIAKAIPKHMGTVTINGNCAGATSADTKAQRPDIVVWKEGTKKIFIIDISCPFEKRYGSVPPDQNQHIYTTRQ